MDGLEPANDDVANPAHYRLLTPEPITVIEGWNCNFRVGSAIGYLARLDRKGGPADAITDIKKAMWYLRRELAAREEMMAKSKPEPQTPDCGILQKIRNAKEVPPPNWRT